MNCLRTLARSSACRSAAPAAARRANAFPCHRLARIQTRAFRAEVPLRTQQNAPIINEYVDAGTLVFGQPVHETHPHLLRSGERE
ncbi:hypothetical protein IMZ48_41660 [Candidatus Bathyarchaeota archaeon]|nr:hypothetical protein [Candidatus Bathyarchaeota archaeon]